MKWLFAGWAFAAVSLAQSPPATASEELEALRKSVQDASSSTVDLIRALEGHLAKYPASARRTDIEQAIVKAAIEAKDEVRIARYGERALERNPNDIGLLDKVTHALIVSGDVEALKRCVKLGAHFEQLVRGFAGQPAQIAPDMAKRKDEIDRILGRALLVQAIANGKLGNIEAAVELARKSFQAIPTAEAAVELGRRLAESNKTVEAYRAFADAFVVPDAAVTESDRAAIRVRMGELYRKAKGSEIGLGDVVLEAYDRLAAGAAARRLAMRQIDPNRELSNPLEFTLSGLQGDKLPLASLAGKVVVMDFWATWCGPCRVQHPLYEELKKRFAARPEVVFLAINGDEDRSVVKPFVEQQGWSHKVYFEDGLSRALNVNQLPTTIIFGKTGKIVSRMNGFDPATFVDIMIERINEGLK